MNCAHFKLGWLASNLRDVVESFKTREGKKVPKNNIRKRSEGLRVPGGGRKKESLSHLVKGGGLGMSS